MNTSFQVRTISSSLKARPASAAGLLLLLVVLTAGPRPVSAFDFTASLEHQISGGPGRPTVSRLLKDRAFRISDDYTLDLTDAISAGAGISYNKRNSSQGVASETVNPYGSVSLHNDLFRLGLHGQTSTYRRTKSGPYDTSSWGLTFSPSLSWVPGIKVLKPALGLNYGETQSTAAAVDQHSSYYGGILRLHLPANWGFTYGYNWSRRENRLALTDTEGSSHYGTLSGDMRFWQDRGTCKFSQAVGYSSATNSGIVPASGAIERPFLLAASSTQTQFFVREEAPVPDNTYHQAGSPLLSLAPEPGQKESWDLVLSGLREVPGSPTLTGGQQPPQKLNKLRLAIVSNDTDTSSPADYWEAHQGDVTWTLYATMDDFNSTTAGTGGLGVTWQSVAVVAGSPDFISSPGTTNSSLATPYFQFELATPLDISRYKALKIVVSYQPTAVAPLPLQINAAEGVSVEYAKPGSSYSNSNSATSYQTNANVNLRISSTLTGTSHLLMSYGAGYFNGQVSGGLFWNPLPMINPSLTFNESQQRFRDAPTAITRTYGMNVPVKLLPTFNVNFGMTRTEQFKGGLKTISDSSYIFSAAAVLYPDLTANFNEAFNTQMRVNGDGTTTDGENYTAGLGLQARLTPKLTCGLDTTYLKVFKPRPLASTASSSRLNFSYRISEMISLSGHVDKTWIGEGSTIKNFTLSMIMLNTRKTRAMLYYSYQQTGLEAARQSVGGNGDWEISKMFFLRSSAYYDVVQRDWGVNTSLHIRI